MREKTIWKFELAVEDCQSLEVPIDCRPLTVRTQYGKPCLWCLVDPTSGPGSRKVLEVFTFGTGHPVRMHPDAQFVGTYQLQEGALVFHVFVR